MFFNVSESSVAQQISLFALPTRKRIAKIFTDLLIDLSSEVVG